MNMIAMQVAFALVGCGYASRPAPIGPYVGPAVWVFDSVSLGGPDIGFDLDNHETMDTADTIGCGRLDGEHGEDNRLGLIADGIAKYVSGESAFVFTDAVANGRLLWLARGVASVDGRDAKYSALELHRALDADDDPTNNFEGRPPGRFRIDSAFLDESGMARTRLDASFENGKLITVSGTCFDVPVVAVDGEIVDIDIRDCHMEARLGEGQISDGLLGGWVPIEDLLTALRDVSLFGFDPDGSDAFLSAVLAGHADIDAIPAGRTSQTCGSDSDCLIGRFCKDATCVEPDGNCDALSTALELHAVAAEIVEE